MTNLMGFINSMMDEQAEFQRITRERKERIKELISDIDQSIERIEKKCGLKKSVR